LTIRERERELNEDNMGLEEGTKSRTEGALRRTRIEEAIFYLDSKIPAERALKNFGHSNDLATCAWLVANPDLGAQALATKLVGDLSSELDLAEEERQKARDRRRQQIDKKANYQELRALSDERMYERITDSRGLATLQSKYQKEETDPQKREKAVENLSKMIQEEVEKANYGTVTTLGTVLRMIASPHRDFKSME